MRVGAMLPTTGSIELNETALDGFERLGMDSIWLADHLLGFLHPALWPEIPGSVAIADPDAWLDPFCIAAIAGRRTSLSIGTAVTDSVRRRGADLARTALTLQDACRGGFILGIGAGEAVSTLPFGYRFDRPIGGLEGALREIRGLIDTGAMPSGVGRSGLGASRPDGRPDVWVAASAPRSLRLAGRYGDGWLPTASDPDLYAQQYGVVRASAAAAGRATPTAGLSALVLFGASRDSAASQLDASPIVKLVTLLSPAAVWERFGLEHPAGRQARGYLDVIPHDLDPDLLRDVAPKIPVEMVEELVLMGSADELAAKLRPYGAAGAEHLVLGDLTGLMYAPEMAASLMPQLASLGAALREPATGGS